MASGVVDGAADVYNRRMLSWKSTAVVTVLAAYLFYLMEWLFFVTKPSFMSTIGLHHKVVILVAAPLPQTALGLIAIAVLALVAALVNLPRLHTTTRALARVVPAIALGSLLLLLLDNFTNTIFGFQIQLSSGIGKWIYAVVTAGIYVLGYVIASRVIRRIGVGPTGRWVRTAIAIPALSLVVILISSLLTHVDTTPIAGLTDAQRSALPNIVMIGGDGIEADHVSAYGYKRKTTQFIDSQMYKALVAKNAFANSAHTRSSLSSMLTGRLPTETRVIYPPDVLRGDDVFRHLPGILKDLGYTTMHVSMRHYGDPYDWNLRDGFDRSTFRDSYLFQVPGRIAAALGPNTSYFIERVTDRVRVRALWLFHDNLPAAIDEAVAIKRQRTPDSIRLNELTRFVEETPEPFFAHAHFMGTHGTYFAIDEQHFSKGKEQDQPWMVDFYDDAIREFDGDVSSLFESLEQRGILSNTLVIVYSDHGRDWNNRVRLPLLFFFPDAIHAGIIQPNVQNVDIAPTVLDYIGVVPPEWMTGRSLLAGPPDRMRPIFGVVNDPIAFGLGDVPPQGIKPPFYSMGVTTMILCNRVYMAYWFSGRLLYSRINGHTDPCEPDQFPRPREAENMILEHLRERGYDVEEVEVLEKRLVKPRKRR